MFCVLLHARVSLSIHSFGFSFRSWSLLSFCLSTFISTLCFSCSSLSHVLVNFYVFGISIMLFSDCIMYLVWDSAVVASWTTMYFIFRCEVFCLFYVCDSVIVFHLLQIYLQRGILSNSSPTCADANGWKISGCYITPRRKLMRYITIKRNK